MIAIHILSIFPECFGIVGTGAAILGASLIGGATAASASSKASKAASQAADAAKSAGINVADVAAQANQQALKNARDSVALEKELTPETAALRTESMKKLLAAQGNAPKAYAEQVAPTPYAQQMVDKLDPKYRDALTNMFNEKQQFQDYGQGALSNEANAMALEQLRLGGKLDQETANQVGRTSAARAGRVGGGALGLGRDLSARDLGLTSIGLQNQRLGMANQFGREQDAFAAQRSGAMNSYNLQQQAQRANLGLGLENLNVADRAYAGQVFNANRADYNANNQLASQIYNQNRDYYANQNQQNFSNMYNTAQFAQGIARPVTGLDPGSIADLYVGNSNAKQSALQNAAAIRAQGASGLMGVGGQILGSAVGGIMGAASKAPPPVYNYTPP